MSSYTMSASCSGASREPQVIEQTAFPVEPWRLRETALDLGTLAQTESLFALANGHIGIRGNLDEGEPHGLPGTYLSSFYELRPLPYAEAGYGFPESGQTIRVRTVRLVSFTQRAVVAFLYEVEPLDASARLILQSELVANEQLPPMSKDPRVAAVLDHPLQAEEMLEQKGGGLLVHRT